MARATAVVFNAEDSAGDTLRPCLEMLGADVGRVWVLNTRGLVVLDVGTSELEAVIKTQRPALVVIDPLTARGRLTCLNVSMSLQMITPNKTR